MVKKILADVLKCFFPSETEEDSLDYIARIVDCISDDKLQDAVFFTFLNILSANACISESIVEQQIKYAVQVLWELFKNNGHSLKQKHARYIANESHLALEAILSKCSESQGEYIQLCGVKVIRIFMEHTLL